MATSERLTVECVRECAEWVPGPSHSVPAPDWRDARALAREVLERREDERVAATDYQILIPEPGTPMAVLLSANVLMRRERATLTATEARLAEAEKRADAAVAMVEAAWREGWKSGGHAAGGFPLASAARTWDDEGWECSESAARLAQIGGEAPDYAAIEQADKESARD